MTPDEYEARAEQEAIAMTGEQAPRSVVALTKLAWMRGYRDGTQETTDAFRELLPPDKTDPS